MHCSSKSRIFLWEQSADEEISPRDETPSHEAKYIHKQHLEAVFDYNDEMLKREKLC